MTGVLATIDAIRASAAAWVQAVAAASRQNVLIRASAAAWAQEL